jgi:hypothetical protein
MASSAPLAASRRFMSLDAGSLPYGQLREGPHFIPRVCVSVPPSVPRWTEWVHLAVASPLVQAFTFSALVRHPRFRARRFSRGCVSRLQSSLDATARRLARPSPTRTFTLELSPPESPPKDVEYDYAGSQPIPAAGLAPATHAALWAASRASQRIREWNQTVLGVVNSASSQFFPASPCLGFDLLFFSAC